MSKYLFVYHGGKKPESKEEGDKIMKQWKDWFISIGEAIHDTGAPVGPSKTVKGDKSVVDDGGSNPVNGYTIIKADSMEEAIEIAKKCPLDESANIELAQIKDMQM